MHKAARVRTSKMTVVRIPIGIEVWREEGEIVARAIDIKGRGGERMRPNCARNANAEGGDAPVDALFKRLGLVEEEIDREGEIGWMMGMYSRELAAAGGN